MWRTALRPRWLALLVLVLLLATGMAWLGTWQLGRARDQGSDAQAARLAVPVVELTSLLGPQQLFPAEAADRPVTVEGTWDGARQLVVADRWRDGASGYWVLTPFRLADGSGIAVVRGWTDSLERAVASAQTLPPASRTVRIGGVLRPGEPGIDREPGAGSGLPQGQLDRIDPVELIERWPTPLFTGYLVLTDPAPSGRGGELTAVPPASGSGQLALQNLSYALQWWLFAAFGIFLWWRLVRDDHRGTVTRQSAGSGAGA
ncbi:MAG: SURF1 family protein [Kineosporiaceae bacterium]